MKKLLLTLAAIPAATLALEASAQTNVNAGGTVAIQNRIANLDARIDMGIREGVIDRREAADLRTQMSELRRLEARYAANGLTRSERRALQQRIRTVRDRLRMAGGTNWANRYGWADSDFDVYGNAYGTTGWTYDQYGRRIPVPTVTYDQYGRPITSGYYGQGGPYEPVPQTSNVLGGVLGSVLGGNRSGLLGTILGNGGLGVGDLITGALGSVLGGASNFGYQDRSNVYFRTDGQRVYEIDARTNRVIRIHPMR